MIYVLNCIQTGISSRMIHLRGKSLQSMLCHLHPNLSVQVSQKSHQHQSFQNSAPMLSQHSLINLPVCSLHSTAHAQLSSRRTTHRCTHVSSFAACSSKHSTTQCAFTWSNHLKKCKKISHTSSTKHYLYNHEFSFTYDKRFMCV